MRAASVMPSKVLRFKDAAVQHVVVGFKNRRYWAENVKEAFGTPGGWYLDKPTGTLTYMPLPGEKPDEAVVEALFCRSC